jgi:hypothetical protein
MLRLKYWFLTYILDLMIFVSAIVLLFVSDFIPYLRLLATKSCKSNGYTCFIKQSK